ncbi:uncharacterized protein LOC133205125 [Saccostrea echinata]|uniref:uncharacterized protein LOC133205125 n=1 Tax=Saccostrea echinata TaxID=191078 RepID=UPI002A827555|nr:uncharacterized protein LOC133205125 [Saccostrea echinata]
MFGGTLYLLVLIWTCSNALHTDMSRVNDWGNGRCEGHFTFPIHGEDIGRWECIITFSEPVTGISEWMGDIIKHSTGNTVYVLVNKPHTGIQRDGQSLSRGAIPEVKPPQLQLSSLISPKTVSNHPPFLWVIKPAVKISFKRSLSCVRNILKVSVNRLTFTYSDQNTNDGTMYNYNEVLIKSIIFSKQLSGQRSYQTTVRLRGGGFISTGPGGHRRGPHRELI